MILGRENEYEAVAAFLSDVPVGPRALVIEGEPGIGKSTLWAFAVERARVLELRVLTCRPTGSDSELSFLALADLLPAEPPGLLDVLPEPQREALEIALLRRRRGRAPDPRAVAAATLSVLRHIVSGSPCLVAIDDVHWIDAATARALTFAVRRLAEEPLAFLFVRPQSEDAPPFGIEDALPAGSVVRLRLGPLAPATIGQIVQERAGVALSRPELLRLCELAGGNPFYALEIVRAQTRGDQAVTGQAMPIPKSFRDDVVRVHLADLSVAERDALLLAAAMARPTIDALRRAGGEGVDDLLQAAVDAGVLRVTGGDVRFTHPLYRSAVYADASRARRHRAHRVLADVADDPEERAQHLALSAESPDAEIADAVEQAAVAARARGAPDTAADLLEHAIRLTPRADLTSLRRRLLLAAMDRFSAGDAEGARSRASEALLASSTGPARAEALRTLARIEIERGAATEARAALEEALAEAEDDSAIRAEVHRQIARLALRAGEVGAAERHATAAVELADETAGGELDTAAVTTLAEVEILLARPSPPLERALAAPGGPRLPVQDSPELVAARRDVFEGRTGDARERLSRLLELASERGDEPGRRVVTTMLAELELRSGRWSLATNLAGEARSLAEQLGLNDAVELGLLAYAAAGRGEVEEARELVRAGLQAARDDRPALLWNMSAAGFLELSLGRAEDAIRHLGRAGGLLATTGIVDPAAFPFLADEAEALVAVGELDVAERRTSRLEELGDTLGRQVLRGQAARCRGLLSAASVDLERSLSFLTRAVELHQEAGSQLELGRSWLALGAVRRRDRQKKPARDALDRARELFEELGCRAWAERAREEAARIGGRRTSVGELTDAEARVARLAAAGMTNREIARSLFMSVRTVEGHLSRVYAKLGLRSRTELAVFFQPPD